MQLKEPRECIYCGDKVRYERYELGYTSCMGCGELRSKRVKRTIVPIHKSNYMVITDMNELKGINNKGGLHR